MRVRFPLGVLSNKTTLTTHTPFCYITPMTPEQLNFVAYANGFQEGFQMTLDNGITVSIAFGARNYCDRGVRTCETAMWDARGNYIHYKGDDVQGYQTPADVLTLLSFAAALPMGDD